MNWVWLQDESACAVSVVWPPNRYSTAKTRPSIALSSRPSMAVSILSKHVLEKYGLVKTGDRVKLTAQGALIVNGVKRARRERGAGGLVRAFGDCDPAIGRRRHFPSLMPLRCPLRVAVAGRPSSL